jgi:hypothetical protein
VLFCWQQPRSICIRDLAAAPTRTTYHARLHLLLQGISRPGGISISLGRRSFFAASAGNQQQTDRKS